MTLARLVPSILLLVLANASCGDAVREDATPDAGLRTISVTAMEHHYAARGESEIWDLGAVASLTVRDAAGAFLREPVPESDHGHYQLQVHEGLVYLGIFTDYQFDKEFIVDPRDQVDADWLAVGRDPRGHVGAPLTFTGEGLLPWKNGDGLHVLCPNLADVYGLDPTIVPFAATTFGPERIEAFPELISAAQGDELWLLQQRRDDVGGVRYWHYERALYRADVEQAGGTAAEVSGPLLAIPSEQLDLDVRLAQFAAVLGVEAGALGGRASLRFLPYGVPRSTGLMGGSYRLVDLDLADLAADQVVSLPYGNPFPASWALVFELSVSGKREDYALPGTMPLLLGGGLLVEMPLANAEAAPIGPPIGPVGELLVDGQPASAGVAHAAETAVLSWQAPALGAAAGYVVDVYGLRREVGSPYTTPTGVARFYTTLTSVQLLPGLLEPGTTYFYAVGALSGGIDVRSAPFRTEGVYAASRVLSGKFTR